MTLLYMEGFETCRDDSDVRIRGWVAPPTKLQTGYAPSVTPLSGSSLRLVGNSNASTAAGGVAGVPDIGYYNTGLTVNQAWQAGGFTFGFGGKFNSGTPLNYGSTILGNPNGIVFDGTNYWSIQYNSSTSAYSVAYSPNLQTWTISPNQPALTLSQNTTISYMGNNVIAVMGSGTAGSALICYYATTTSPAAMTWTSQTLGTASIATLPPAGVGIATGNSTYPHVVIIGAYGATSTTSGTGIYVGTLGGTMTLVSAATINYLNNQAPIRIIGGNIYINWYNANNATNYCVTANASSSTLNSASAWTSATYNTGIGKINDFTYNPVSNQYSVATSSGMFSFANTGAAGTPVSPTGTIATTTRWNTAQIQNVFWNTATTSLVGFGASGYIITSPDGYTWTPQASGHLIPVGVSATDWRSAIWDGTQYVLCSDQVTGIVATTTDGINNYQSMFIREGAETRQSTNNYGYVGIYTGSAPVPQTGLWSCNSSGMIAVVPSTVSAGNRSIAMNNAFNGTPIGTATNLSVSTLFHYFEIVATAIPGTANTFSVQLYVDGALFMQSTTNVVLGSSTTDSTSLIILSLDRYGIMNGYDDFYFVSNNGLGYSGALGPINIVARRPEVDVSDQWTKVGVDATNSLSVNQAALSSGSSNYVQSQNAGDKDVYRSTDAIPANYNVKAVSVEGHFTKISTSTPTVNLGIISGTTESDTANLAVTSTSPMFTSKIYEKDPNGNISWTVNAAQNTQITINHVS